MHPTAKAATAATTDLTDRERDVLALADGRRPVAEIAALLSEKRAAPVTREDVFAACDSLADKGLLETRIAPPAGASRTAPGRLQGTLTRRGAVRFGAGLAAAGLAAGFAAPAFAQSESLEKEAIAKSGGSGSGSGSEEEIAKEADAKSGGGSGNEEELAKESDAKTGGGNEEEQNKEAGGKESQNKEIAAKTDSEAQSKESAAKTDAGTGGGGTTTIGAPGAGLILAGGVLGLAAWREQRGKRKAGDGPSEDS